MDLHIREYREEKDREQLAPIWSVAFSGGEPVPEDKRLDKEDSSTFVVEARGRIVAGFRVHHMTATRGETALRCGGVAAVAVAPEFRQAGLGARMMEWSLDWMREEGFLLTSLYAFREGYYRKFGYECAGVRMRITCPNQRFPRVEPSLPVRQLTPDDWQQLEPAYARFARRYSGMNLPRHPERWKSVFGRRPPDPIVYAAGDPVEAYAILRVSADFWGDETVSELVWATPEGYRSVFAALFGIGINRASLAWCEPSDGPFLATSVDQGVKAAYENPIMFRVLDVPAALGALKPQASGDFSLLVHDEGVPQNRGPWRVSFSLDGVSVEACDSAGIEMDIRHFSQAFLGEPSFAGLLGQGFVKVCREADAKSAADLLTPRATYCLDMF
ncbi:MAG: GNAT family N-acetyltransferase [Armatimonadetes bacterium]|nr:GNAT family N-acetyltransferase [Armatimonadota bacterium]